MSASNEKIRPSVVDILSKMSMAETLEMMFDFGITRDDIINYYEQKN